MMLGARTAAWGGKTLPYDTEVEWLESSGDAYIDTLKKPNSLWKFRAMTEVFDSTEVVPFGAWDAWLSNMWGLDIKPIDPNVMFTFGNKISYVTKPAENIIGKYKSFFDGYTFKYGLYYGTKISKINFECSNTMYLFRVHRNVGGAPKNGRCRVYFLEIEDNIGLVLNFVPIRFTNEDGVSEGAMYDKVSGKLYRNAGTGEFIIGPDKTT